MQRSTYYKKLINCARWRVLRNIKVSDSPLCECCLLIGRTVPAVEVHHLKPVETGTNSEQQKLFAYDYKNLIALCHACHVKKHIELQSKTKQAARIKAANETKLFFDTYLPLS